MKEPVEPGASAPESLDRDSGFVRELGLFDSSMVVIGAMIGSGIFIVPADMARNIGSAGWLLVAWLFTGVLTIAAALSYGELASMMPRAGGMYVYLREAFSPVCGYLYGWTLFTVIQTGTIAAVAVAFARFLGVLLPAVSEQRYLIPPAAYQRTLCGFAVLGSTGRHFGHRAAYLDKLQGNSLRQDYPESVHLGKGSGSCRAHPGGTNAGREPCGHTRKPAYVLETSRLYAGERRIDRGHYVWPVRGDLRFSIGLLVFGRCLARYYVCGGRSETAGLDDPARADRGDAP